MSVYDPYGEFSWEELGGSSDTPPVPPRIEPAPSLFFLEQPYFDFELDSTTAQADRRPSPPPENPSQLRFHPPWFPISRPDSTTAQADRRPSPPPEKSLQSPFRWFPISGPGSSTAQFNPSPFPPRQEKVPKPNTENVTFPPVHYLLSGLHGMPLRQPYDDDAAQTSTSFPRSFDVSAYKPLSTPVYPPVYAPGVLEGFLGEDTMQSQVNSMYNDLYDRVFQKLHLRVQNESHVPPDTRPDSRPPLGHAHSEDDKGLSTETEPINRDIVPERPFFCTYCYEMHSPESSSFRRKADWKRHESRFHETGMSYHCMEPDCSRTFSHQKNWKRHSEVAHGQVLDAHITHIPEKRVYACGFKGCKRLSFTWKEHCDHVARCMLEAKGQEKWSYSWRILNLLRQEGIKPIWKQVKSYWCEQLKIKDSDLQWDYETSTNLVQQLECQTYGDGGDVESFLERLFMLGLPQQGPGMPLVTTRNLQMGARSHEVAPHGAFSDSGYGTASHCSQKISLLTDVVPIAHGDTPLLTSDPKHMHTESMTSSEVMCPDIDDTATVYSDATSLSDSRIDVYISGLVEELFERLKMKDLSLDAILGLSTVLPDLLKAMALKFGFNAPSQMHRDVMFFIHKHRIAISERFKNKFKTEEADVPEQTPREPPSTEIMDRWFASQDDHNYGSPHQPSLEELGGEEYEQSSDEEDEVFGVEEDATNSDASLKQYKEFIRSDAGYAWLLSRLLRNIELAGSEHDVMNNIKESILSSCRWRVRISRRRPAQGCNITFCVDWDPFAFLDEQEYEESYDQAIANAITLTGSCRDAQALSSYEYIKQTWASTGHSVMRLIQDLVRKGREDGKATCTTPTGTAITAYFDGFSMVVEASGIPDFVAEVGEQLAWLGAALRTSPRDAGVIYSVPYVEDITPAQSGSSETGHRELQFAIKFRFEECQGSTDGLDHSLPENSTLDSPDPSRGPFGHPNGQCWHALFRNPVVVPGFPIPRRSENGTGLELPLNMVAALISTRCVENFNGKYFIKGFSSMLVPTKQSDDTLIWHMIYNDNPNARISYLDCSVDPVDVCSMDLERTRHIVGWCSEAICNVGTLAANYSIRKSNLPTTHSVYALEQAQITGGQIITGTAIFSLGKKDKPVHISRLGFMNQIQWISSKYVIFWDEGEKRGWLVNGASALLHLLRASLEHSKKKFRTAFLLDQNAFPDLTGHMSADSAIQALINEQNRDLKLYVDKTDVYDETTGAFGDSKGRTESKRVRKYYRVEDQIQHLYSMLEKLIDHQADMERRSGLQINPRPRRQLEGWDFRDLVTAGDPFFPRVTTLQAIGKGWVDFTRAIHAVTLFGRGFGDLIRPNRIPGTICSQWSSLPQDRYYLAACVSDLMNIMENCGDASKNPMRLCENILWHMKHATFQPCPCTTGRSSNHHDPVQVLFPSKFKTKLRKKPQVSLDDMGAVIFGHNKNLHWHWRDSGDPVKGDPPEDEPDTSSFDDSGLGSSLESSSSPSSSSSGGSLGGITPSQDDLPLPSETRNMFEPTATQSTHHNGGAQHVGQKRPLRTIMTSMSKRMKFNG